MVLQIRVWAPSSKNFNPCCEPYIWLKYFSESSNSCLQVLFTWWLVGLILFYEFISNLVRNQKRTYQGLSARLHVNQKYLAITLRPWWRGWRCLWLISGFKVDFKIPSENTIGSPWWTVEFKSLCVAFKATYNLLLQLSILPHPYVNPALKIKQSTLYPVWLSG